MNEPGDKRFGVWYSGLTGTFYAGWAKCRDPELDSWEAVGKRHDVTADVERYIASALRNAAVGGSGECRKEQR